MYPMESFPETQELDYTVWKLLVLSAIHSVYQGCLYPSIISVYICESCIVLFLLLINNGNISVNIYKPASLS